MANKNEHRIKKLEQKNMNYDDLITEIVVHFIAMDGSVRSSMIKKRIDGVWCEQNGVKNLPTRRFG